MNERIRLLAEQAEGTKKHVPAVWQFYDHELEKFALLIVRECADLFEVEWGEEKLTGNDVGYVVKKHFGVDSVDDVETCPKCGEPDSGTSCGLPDCGWITGVEA